MPRIIDRTEVERLVADEAAQLVEVLPRDEFTEEHLSDAINLPLKQLDPGAVGVLDGGRPVIVYCWDAL
ncbi:MAG: rhodanese-like domain-containing protein [Actinomycetota bacterium]